MASVETLIDSGDDSHAEEIRLLSMAIQAYEGEHFQIGDSNPVRVIKFFMEQNG